MIKQNYSELLKDPRWQKKRLKVLERDSFTCQECGDTKKTLHVHHLKYNENPWEAKGEDLQTLCEDCHNIEKQNNKFKKYIDKKIEDEFNEIDGFYDLEYLDDKKKFLWNILIEIFRFDDICLNKKRKIMMPAIYNYLNIKITEKDK